MPHLYKFRSGLILNLEAIRYATPEVSLPDLSLTWSPKVRMHGETLDISKEDYDELVEKCERYAN